MVRILIIKRIIKWKNKKSWGKKLRIIQKKWIKW